MAYANIGGLSVWVGHAFWKHPQGWFLWLGLWLLVVWLGLRLREKPRPRPVLLSLGLH